MDFSKTLIDWYLLNMRDLPWRNITNPYAVWLSEIILQQTKVAQGLPYYLKFIKVYPTVFDLAIASEEEVLKNWQGLGYYSRARNLHWTAKHIVFELKGEFPTTYRELRKLKGIGDYTAAAIASFCYKEHVPVVDGNVFRFLSRYYDIKTDITASVAKKEFADIAKKIMPKGKEDIFNQAIMEFGALYCVPSNPNCDECVFKKGCLAFKNVTVMQRPVKLKKFKIKERFINYLVFNDEKGKTILNKRTQKGIWHNLYDFPKIETTKQEKDLVVQELICNQGFISNKIKKVQLHNSNAILHKLSHQHLFIKFWKIHVFGEIEKGKELFEIKKLPTPKVVFNFIENEWN